MLVRDRGRSDRARRADPALSRPRAEAWISSLRRALVQELGYGREELRWRERLLDQKGTRLHCRHGLDGGFPARR